MSLLTAQYSSQTKKCLIHFMRLVSFFSSEIFRKPEVSWCFQGHRNRPVVWNGLIRVKSKGHKRTLHFFTNFALLLRLFYSNNCINRWLKMQEVLLKASAMSKEPWMEWLQQQILKEDHPLDKLFWDGNGEGDRIKTDLIIAQRF